MRRDQLEISISHISFSSHTNMVCFLSPIFTSSTMWEKTTIGLESETRSPSSRHDFFQMENSEAILDSHPWTRFGIARELYEVLSVVYHTLCRRFHFPTDPFAAMPAIASQVLLLPFSLTTGADNREVVEQLKESRLSFTDICAWHGKLTCTSALSLRPLVSRVAAVQRFLTHDTDKQFGLSPAEQAMLMYDSDEGTFQLPAGTCALLSAGKPLVSLKEFLKTFGEHPEQFTFPPLVSEERQNSHAMSPHHHARHVPAAATNNNAQHQSPPTRQQQFFLEQPEALVTDEQQRAAEAALRYANKQRTLLPAAVAAAAPELVVNRSPLQPESHGSAVVVSVALGPREEDDASTAAEAATATPADSKDTVCEARSPSGKEIAALLERDGKEKEKAADAASSEPSTAKETKHAQQEQVVSAAAAAPPIRRVPPTRQFFRDLNQRVIAVLAVRAACAAYAESKTEAVSRFLIGLDRAESSVPFADDIRSALGRLDFEHSFTLSNPSTDLRAATKNQIFVVEVPAMYIVAVAGCRQSVDMVDLCDFLPVIDPLRSDSNPKGAGDHHPASYHRGIYRRAALLPTLIDLCPNARKPVMLTGHGLGGSIAEVYLRLFAGEAARAQGSFLVTFGAPSIHRSYLVDQHKVWRFVVEGDFVPAVFSLALPASIAYSMPPRRIGIKELTAAPNCAAPAPASRSRPLETVLQEVLVGPHEVTRYVANVERAAVLVEGKFPPEGTFPSM